MSHSYPQDLRYTNDHEWLRPLGGGRAAVGVTAFAVEQLGDITLVDLPKEGDLVTKGQRFGTIESVKSVSDLFAPVSGKIARVNPMLKDKPESVNDSPYGDGWMVEIDVDAGGVAEIEELLTADGYADLVASQG
jgi:glycine cleavage system H protein